MKMISTVRKNFTVTELWVAIAIFTYLTSVGAFVLTRPLHSAQETRTGSILPQTTISASLLGIKTPS